MVSTNNLEFSLRSFHTNSLVVFLAFVGLVLNKCVNLLITRLFSFLQLEKTTFVKFFKKKFWKNGVTVIKSPFVFKNSKLTYDIKYYISVVKVFIFQSGTFNLSYFRLGYFVKLVKELLYNLNDYFSIVRFLEQFTFKSGYLRYIIT